MRLKNSLIPCIALSVFICVHLWLSFFLLWPAPLRFERRPRWGRHPWPDAHPFAAGALVTAVISAAPAAADFGRTAGSVLTAMPGPDELQPLDDHRDARVQPAR